MQDLAENEELIIPLANLGMSPYCSDNCWAKFVCINWRLLRKKSEMVLRTRITDHVVMCKVEIKNLIRTDWMSATDPVVGALVTLYTHTHTCTHTLP